MKKKDLIQLFAESKYQTTLYPGDLSGKTYWEGAVAAYLKLLNRYYPSWANLGRGRQVWLASPEDKAVLLNEPVKA